MGSQSRSLIFDDDCMNHQQRNENDDKNNFELTQRSHHRFAALPDTSARDKRSARRGSSRSITNSGFNLSDHTKRGTSSQHPRHPADSGSDRTHSNPLQLQHENPFVLLQQQLIHGQRQKIKILSKSERCNSPSDAFVHARPEVTTDKTGQPCAEASQSTPSYHDWPFRDKQSVKEQVTAKGQISLKAARASMLGSLHNRSDILVTKELVKTRKRLRKSKQWRTKTDKGIVSCNHSLPQTRLDPRQLSSTTPKPARESQLSQGKHSIAGTRPLHWGSTITNPHTRLSSAVPFADCRELSLFVTPSPLASRASSLAKATQKSAPFSLSNGAANQKRSSSLSESKAFTPAFLQNSKEDNQVNVIDKRQDEPPWFYVTKTSKRSNMSTPKRQAGPLLQKLTTLRSSWKADSVRFHSQMAIQDPRTDKVFMDFQLFGDPVEHGSHTVALGKILSEKHATFAWIVFAKKRFLGVHIRIYNPIPLKIDVTASKVTHVVICTQLHEAIASSQI